jgi:hypothetical protein
LERDSDKEVYELFTNGLALDGSLVDNGIYKRLLDVDINCNSSLMNVYKVRRCGGEKCGLDGESVE